MGDIDSAFREYGPELEDVEFDESEWGGEGEVFTEADLTELAGELLGVASEAELDQFLGKLIKRVGRSVGRVVRSPIGRALGGFLKGVAKRALPLAGSALGAYFGGPLGAQIGGGLASAAGGALGLEAEAVNAEDQEFVGAKQFVRLGGQAIKSALTAPANVNPSAAAQQAVLAAAARLAPGLMGRAPSGTSIGPRGRTGRWVRSGRNVVLLNF